MSEQLRRTEGKSDEEGSPKYYCVLELDQERYGLLILTYPVI